MSRADRRDGEFPFLYVLGMHRSGTSAVTSTLPHLGLCLTREDELMEADKHNAKGYFESSTLAFVNDAILGALGGSWYLLPAVPDGWETFFLREPPRLSLCNAVASVVPDYVPVAWKDPRNCLTLPVWRSIITRPSAAIFVYRCPAEVAASLYARDSMPTQHGRSLWEHYNRSAMRVMKDLPVLVVRYEEALADAASFCEEVADFLTTLDIVSPEMMRCEEGARALDRSMRHERLEDIGDTVLDSQKELLEVLDSLRGAHSSWTVPDLDSQSRC